MTDELSNNNNNNKQQTEKKERIDKNKNISQNYLF